MGSRVRIRLLPILHFVMDFLFPLLKNSKSGVDDRGHRFRSGSPLTNYPHAAAEHMRKDVCGLSSTLTSTTNTRIESSQARLLPSHSLFSAYVCTLPV